MIELNTLGAVLRHVQDLSENAIRESIDLIMEMRRISEVCGLDIAAIDRTIQESSLEYKEKYENEIKSMADVLAIVTERDKK